MEKIKGLISNEEIESLFESEVIKYNSKNVPPSENHTFDKELTIPKEFNHAFTGKDKQDYRIRLAEHKAEDLNGAGLVFVKGFPELHKSPYECFQKPAELEEILFSSESSYKMLLVENSQKEIVAATVINFDKTNKSATWELIAVIPEYRGKGIFSKLAEKTDEFIQKSGVDYASLIASTFQKENQQKFEKLGWKIAGIQKGLVIAPNGKGEYYNRQLVVIYGKNYTEDAETLVPEPELTKKGKDLYEALKRINENANEKKI